MSEVGDRVEVTSRKGPPRLGVIMAVHAGMVTIQWDSGEESSLIPGPGVLSVVPGRARGPRRSGRAAKVVSRRAAPPARTPARRALTAGKTSAGKAKAGRAKVARAKVARAKVARAKVARAKVASTTRATPARQTGKRTPAAKVRATAKKAAKATKKKAR